MIKAILFQFSFFLAVLTSFAQPVITFQPIITGLTQPLDVVNAKDGTGRLFIVEKQGVVRIWDGAALRSDTFLSIRSIVRSIGLEQGLLSLAFHPNYVNNGYFYVWYNNLEGHVTLARYSRSSLNQADSTSGVVLLSIFKPFPNHNGAKLNFGSDGYLYFGTGDGGFGNDPGNRAQNGDSLHGKMLRIDVNNPNPPYYSIPPTNPYITDPAIRDEIIALGLRNPWRWSFDRLTGDLWLADVGQNAWEEVNYVPAANILNKNYGWRCFEATHATMNPCDTPVNNVFPIFEYDRNMATGGMSITGGYVYRGTEFPLLQGYYIASDYVTDHGWLIKANGSGGWDVTFQSAWATDITSYGESEDGALYATSLSLGIVYKVIASGSLPLRLVSFNGNKNGSYHELNWKVADEEPGAIYILEKKTSASLRFEEAKRITATSTRVSNSYTYHVNATTPAYYRLKVIYPNGQVSYSAVVYIKENNQISLVRAAVYGSQLQIMLPDNAQNVSLTDATGKFVFRQNVITNNSIMSIPMTRYSRGVYIISVALENKVEKIKIVY